jgi:hypothetical protein
MATLSRRSPLSAYLMMALTAAAVFVVINLLSAPRPVGEGAVPHTIGPSPTAGSSLEREFLTTVLGEPRVIGGNQYCDAQGCCPTRRITFGTTAPIQDVIAAFEGQGYFARGAGRDTIRTGPWPQARWIAELDLAGRWEWRRIEVSRGPDAGRPDWPTVFKEDSIACGEG